MCGIIGFFNFEDAKLKAETSMELMRHRGRDAYGFATSLKVAHNSSINNSEGAIIEEVIGHCLHSINDFVVQPIEVKKNGNDFVFAANCEIYNWQELNIQHDINSKNDAETFASLLTSTHDIMDLLEEIDGVYAFALWNRKTGKLFLGRDLIGERPLWVYFDKEGRLAFASEKKFLINSGLSSHFIFELNPRHVIVYDINEKYLSRHYRKFLETGRTDESELEILDKTEKLLLKAITKRIPEGRKIGLLFSGGVDSAFLALMLKKLGIDFTCYFSSLRSQAFSDSKDEPWAERIAQSLGLALKKVEMPLSDVEEYLAKVVPIIEDNNSTKVSVALTMYAAAEQARKDGVHVLFSGIGSEDLFAGYKRHKNGKSINNECLAGFRKIYERDLYRDDAIMMSNTIELRAPYLDIDLIRYSLAIPEEMKINEEGDKLILRKIAEKNGLDNEFAFRKKVAAQYGSNFDKAVHKLAGREGKSRPEYLKQFHDTGNVRLGVLMSTGKDSILATQLMLEQNYSVKCFITLQSKNKDSYMYHGPNTHLAKLQSEAAGIPLIMQETKGEKEEELNDLRKAIITAIERYHIEGIVTGALFSNYQRDRIENLCDELGIKCFSPMWHMQQEKELEVLLAKKIKFCIVKIAAEGLSKEWLGKQITQNEVDMLMELNRKMGFNVAGEGGEYESLALDAPFFKKEIVLAKTHIESEDKYTATLIVEEAHLKEKTL